MDYIKALVIIALILFAVALLAGAGLTIIGIGMAIGAAILVMAAIYAVVRATWEWGTNLWGR